MSRMDIRDYSNDYSTQPNYKEKYQEGEEDKPLSASDITAIAESTVNQLLMRDEPRGGKSRSGRRSRSRSRGRSRGKDRSRSRERRRDRSREKSREKNDRPSAISRLEKLKDPRIVTLKGLKSFHKESDIRRKLVDERMRFRDIRVIFNKATNTGTAFVEFMSESEAAKWVRHNRGMLKVVGEHLTMDLNKPLAAPKKDWICEPCGEKNHYARDSCYSCQSEKHEAPEKPRLRSSSPSSSDQDSAPSNVLMFRGLDYRTTEEQIQRRLRDLTNVPIKDVRLITDKYTNKSRGFAFVEVASIADGTSLMKRVQALEPPLEINGRKVKVSYQREPGEKNDKADAAIAAAQWSATSSRRDQPGAASATNGNGSSAPADSMPQTIGSYVWDEKSGYYFDQSSGLYYDPKTKYYYNPTDEKYYMWNESVNQYETVTSQQSVDTPAPAALALGAEPGEKGKVAKATKAMNAKKIAKDMERWAKAKNRQQAKANPLPKAEPEQPMEEPSTVQSGNSIALKIAQDYADPVYQQVQAVPTGVAPPPPSIFPISNPNPAMTDEQINRKYEDLAAIACLLCKRKFPSVDNLRRHQELSDLHKTSLVAERESQEAGEGSMLDYRDRAAERRSKFGAESGAPPTKFMRR